jgi:hypothetical protein
MRASTNKQIRWFFFSASLLLFGLLLVLPTGHSQEIPESITKAVYDARYPLDPEGSRRLHDRTFMRVNFLDFEGLMTPTDQRFQHEAIEGVVWNDRNRNGFTDQGERGLSGKVIYLDANHNGRRDKGESYTRTDDHGHYELEVNVGSRYRRFAVALDHDQPMHALEQTWPRYRWQEQDGHFYTLTNIFGEWEDCQFEAHAMGGNLVTIDSPEENRWLSFAFRGNYSRGLYDRIPDRDQRLDPRNNSKLWIGLRRKDNQWGWASGATFAFQADLWSPWYESVYSAYLVTHSGDKPMTWWNGPAAALHEDCHPRGIIEAGKPDRWPPQTVLVPQGIALKNVNFGLDGRQHVHDHSSGGIHEHSPHRTSEGGQRTSAVPHVPQGDVDHPSRSVPKSGILFASDFSRDPGLKTNSTRNYVVSNGVFQARSYTNSQQYGTFPVNYQGESFNLTFDIEIHARDSGDTNFGLFSGSRATNQRPPGDPTIYAIYGGYEQGLGLRGYDANGVSFELPAGGLAGPFKLNTRYHNEISYDAATRTATLRVSSPDQAEIFSGTVRIPAGLPPLPQLGASSVGSWSTSGRYQRATFDNLVLSVGAQSH